VPVQHRFVNPKPDGPDATVVRPSDWNDSHDVEIGTDDLVDGSVIPVKANLAQPWVFSGVLRRSSAPVVDNDVASKAYVDEQVATGFSPFTAAEKLALELELGFKTSKPLYYMEPGYDDLGNVTRYDYWDSSEKGIQLFEKVLSYTGYQLDQSVLTRISDSATLTKAFAYDGDGNLLSVTRS